MTHSTRLCTLFLLSFVVQFGLALPNQSDPGKSIERARILLAEEKYLAAATLFKHIASTSTDSVTIAEALYGFVTSGDRAAKLALIDYPTRYRYDSAAFAAIGIQLKIVHYFETYCVNADAFTRYLLSTSFSNTPHGELAAFDLITNEVDTSGFPELNDPHAVIHGAFAFLDRYPGSLYRYDVYHILARGFQDLWQFAHSEEYSYMVSDSLVANPQPLREDALRYYRLTKDHQDLLLRYDWGADDDDVLNKLENNQGTNGYYFFGD